MNDSPQPRIARETSDRRATDRARALRAEASMPERVLWNRLRARRLKGLKFRRQQPMAGYTLDFYCDEARLAVEIDGETHGARRAQDARRDAALAQCGVLTLRIPASEVSRDVDRALLWILNAARERLPRRETPHPAASPPPSPTGEGGDNPGFLHSPR